MTARIKVYCASKLEAAQGWRDLENEWFNRPDVNVEFTGRWYKYFEGREIMAIDSPAVAQAVWMKDMEDVLSSDVVLLLGTQGKHLRGGLVEAGMALGAGKFVIVVGEHPDYGTWQYCERVIRAKTLDEVLAVLYTLSVPKRI
jgi:hypothetical protein